MFGGAWSPLCLMPGGAYCCPVVLGAQCLVGCVVPGADVWHLVSSVPWLVSVRDAWCSVLPGDLWYPLPGDAQCLFSLLSSTEDLWGLPSFAFTLHNSPSNATKAKSYSEFQRMPCNLNPNGVHAAFCRGGSLCKTRECLFLELGPALQLQHCW